jgi:flagellar biosynthesis GTPase FlhF
MTEHTFRSPDTATAMDRVQRELGDDAYILSIQNVDGMVEIKAIKEPIYAAGGFRRNQQAKYKKSALVTDTTASGFVFDDNAEQLAPDGAVQEGQGNTASPDGVPASEQADKPTAVPGYHNDASDPNTLVFNGGDTAFAASLDPVTAQNIDNANPDQIAKWGYDGYLEGVVPLVASLEGFELSAETPQDLKARKGFVASDHRTAEENLLEDVATELPSGAAVPEHIDPTDPQIGGVLISEGALSEGDGLDGSTTRNVTEQPPHLDTIENVQTEAELMDAFQSGSAGDGDITELPATGADILAPSADGSLGSLMPMSVEKAEVLADRGFTDSFIAALPLERASQSVNELMEEAVRRLSKGLVPPLFSTDPLTMSQLAIIGPPGSGKTTLAAKLACERHSRSSAASMLISLRAPGSINDNKLRDMARMMNMPHTEIRTLVPTMPKKHVPFIVDFDNIGYKNTISRLSDLNDMAPGEPLKVALALPATWSLNALMLLVDTYAHLDPILVMTQMDIGGVGIEEFCNLYDRGVHISLLSGTNAVVNTIKASHEELLYHYLSDLTQFE